MNALFIDEVLDHLNHFEHVVLNVVEKFGIFDSESLLEEGIDHGVSNIVADVAWV